MEEPNTAETHMLKSRAVAVFPIWILLFTTMALPSGANQEAGETKMDYASTQQEILRFEDAVNDVLGNTFSSSPIVVVQTAKGAYTGYGISVFFRVNIHRAVINTPFGQVRSRADISPEFKKNLIEELKARLIKVLQDNGDNFRQLRKEDYVSIVAFIEDRNFPGEPNENKTIVMSASKKDLDEFGRRTDRLKEFKQRIKIVEY